MQVGSFSCLAVIAAGQLIAATETGALRFVWVLLATVAI
jgi:hypothetical protein